jgi:hypothetical protein
VSCGIQGKLKKVWNVNVSHNGIYIDFVNHFPDGDWS